MNIRATLSVLGLVTCFLGLALCLPVITALYFQDGTAFVFAGSGFAVAIIGLAFFLVFRNQGDIRHREGFAVAGFGWLLFGFVAAIPYTLTGVTPTFIDALFESLSGVTTTGATVLSNLDTLPKSILLWRSLTQWFGGMGIIVLTIAMLPFLKVGGMQLFRAEVPGPSTDRLSPRIQDTAKLLWTVYFGFTIFECILLKTAGMDWFDAICHALTTMATGGFSTQDASIAAYNSDLIHWIVIIFMFCAGINFTLHFHLLMGRVTRFRDSEELKIYTAIVLVVTAIIFVINSVTYADPWTNFRDAAFQTVAIVTTTGFGTADFAVWPVALQLTLFLLMFVGGSAGSTSGGIKVVRIMLVFKHARQQVFRLIHPKAVRIIKLDGKPVPEEIVQSVLGFLALFVGLFVIGTWLLTLYGIDLVTAASAVVSCLGNIGPGLGDVGPTNNFAHLPDGVKIILSGCMLLGRLELYTLLVLLFPGFWKK